MTQRKIEHQLNVGIIGTGFGLNVQLPIFQSHPLFNVTGISSIREKSWSPLEMQDNINYYTNWREMMKDQKIDLISIASIPSTHFSISKEVIAAGHHILCEKPFMMNVAEASEILTLQKEADVKGFIDFEWRYLPVRQKVKQLLEHNEIGEIIHIDYQISIPGYQNLISTQQGWMGQSKHFGGMLGALGSHMVDAMTWLVDKSIVWVNAHLKTHISEVQFNNEIEHRDADDTFMAHGELVSGATFQLSVLNSLTHGTGSKLSIFGNNGSIVLTNDQVVELGKAGATLQVIMNAKNEENSYPKLDKVDSRYVNAFYPLLDHIYTAIKNNKFHKDLPTFEHGYQNQLVLEAIKTSSRSSMKINTKEIDQEASIT